MGLAVIDSAAGRCVALVGRSAASTAAGGERLGGGIGGRGGWRSWLAMRAARRRLATRFAGSNFLGLVTAGCLLSAAAASSQRSRHGQHYGHDGRKRNLANVVESRAAHKCISADSNKRAIEIITHINPGVLQVSIRNPLGVCS